MLPSRLYNYARKPGMAPHPIPTGIELSVETPGVLLPLPARNERGEGWGKGKSNKNATPLPGPTTIEVRDFLACEDAATPELRRSGLFVANGSHPAKSPVGAASSASMPLLRSFRFLPFALYKYGAPMGLKKVPSPLIQRQCDPSLSPSYGARVSNARGQRAMAPVVKLRLRQHAKEPIS